MKKEYLVRILAFVVGLSLMSFVLFVFIMNRNPKEQFPYQDLQSQYLKRIAVVYEGEEVGTLSEEQAEELVLVLKRVFHYGRVYQSNLMVGCGGISNMFVLEYHDGHTESIEGSPASGHLYINDQPYQSTVEISDQLYELVCRYAKVLIEEENLATLSDQRKEEIGSVWRKTFPTHSDLVWLDESDEHTWETGIRYYGAYENIIALYIPELTGESTYFIDGIEMDYGIVFYWDEELHGGAWSYENGFVTADTLRHILEVHRTFFDQFVKN